jgi:GDP-L-fucose synthase
LLPALIRKVHIAKKEAQAEIEVWGSGKPRREFMLSDDCAEALLHLMKTYLGEEPVNVGTGEDATVLELLETVARVVDHQVRFRLNTAMPDGMMRKLLDVSVLKALGWNPRHSLEQGISIAYKDYLERFA